MEAESALLFISKINIHLHGGLFQSIYEFQIIKLKIIPIIAVMLYNLTANSIFTKIVFCPYAKYFTAKEKLDCKLY